MAQTAIPNSLQPFIIDVAKRLNIPPQNLAAVIGFETAWTYRTNIKNPDTGATGLIQFMPATAAALGTSTSALAGMNYAEQMEYVYKYLRDQMKATKTNPQDVEGLYMLVFYPAATNKPLNYVFPDSVYRVNKVFDTAKKGYITKADVHNTIANAANKHGFSFATIATGSALIVIIIGLFFYFQFYK